MSYEPTNWKAGDTVTSAKLNKLENGLAAASQGGSSLPTYTNSDDGKVLSLQATGETTYETVTIIEQQTVSLSHGEAILAEGTFDMNWMQANDTATINIDGTDEIFTVTIIYGKDYSGIPVIKNQNNNITINLITGSIDTARTGTMTISGTAEKPVNVIAPAWSAAKADVELLQPEWDEEKQGDIFKKSFQELYEEQEQGKLLFMNTPDGFTSVIISRQMPLPGSGDSAIYYPSIVPMLYVDTSDNTLWVTNYVYNFETEAIDQHYYTVALTPDQ